MSGGSTVSSNGSADTIGRTLACLKMVRTFASAAVLTRTHQMGNMRLMSGMRAVTGSVRNNCDIGCPETHDQEYM